MVCSLVRCQYPPHTQVHLCRSLSPCILRVVSHSLALSLRENRLKRTYGDRNIDAQVQIKSFFVGTSHGPRSYTSVLVLGEFFWECSRVIRCLSDETFTETLETRKQTDGQKKFKYRSKDPKKTKGFGCVVMKAPYYNLGLMYLSSLSHVSFHHNNNMMSSSMDEHLL